MEEETECQLAIWDIRNVSNVNCRNSYETLEMYLCPTDLLILDDFFFRAAFQCHQHRQLMSCDFPSIATQKSFGYKKRTFE